MLVASRKVSSMVDAKLVLSNITEIMLRRCDDASASFGSYRYRVLCSQATAGRDAGGEWTPGRLSRHPAAERGDWLTGT